MFILLRKTISFLYSRTILKYILPDKWFIKMQYFANVGETLNLKHPKTFNEKIQWLKLNYNPEILTILSDKYLVRNYVSNMIGKEYLNKLYGVYDNPSKIDYSKFPNRFVLKCNHGSGYNIIVENKNLINESLLNKKLTKFLKKNYYFEGRESQYKNILPLIVAEEYLSDNEYNQLLDYKFFCFNGNPKLIQVDFNRHTNHIRNFYDLDWNYLELEIHYPSSRETTIKKPEKLAEMIQISKRLSESFPHVRVDLYYVNNTIYFGEMTFTHGNGFEQFNSKSWENKLGGYILLNKITS